MQAQRGNPGWRSAPPSAEAAFAEARQSEEGGQAGSSQGDGENLLGEIFAMRSLTACQKGDGVQAIVLGQQALAHLSEQNLATRAQVTIAMSGGYAALGQPIQVTKLALQSSDLYRDAGDVSSAIICLGTTAVIQSMSEGGCLRKAQRLLERARMLGEQEAHCSIQQ